MITTILPPIAVACSIVVAIIFLAKAKRNLPITQQDATFLWRLHKQRTGCRSHNWHPITQKNSDKIIGFTCECGYRHTEKRPFVGSSDRPRTLIATSSAHGQPSKIRARTAI